MISAEQLVRALEEIAEFIDGSDEYLMPQARALDALEVIRAALRKLDALEKLK